MLAPTILEVVNNMKDEKRLAVNRKISRTVQIHRHFVPRSRKVESKQAI